MANAMATDIITHFFLLQLPEFVESLVLSELTSRVEISLV